MYLHVAVKTAWPVAEKKTPGTLIQEVCGLRCEGPANPSARQFQPRSLGGLAGGRRRSNRRRAFSSWRKCLSRSSFSRSLRSSKWWASWFSARCMSSISARSCVTSLHNCPASRARKSNAAKQFKELLPHGEGPPRYRPSCDGMKRAGAQSWSGCGASLFWIALNSRRQSSISARYFRSCLLRPVAAALKRRLQMRQSGVEVCPTVHLKCIRGALTKSLDCFTALASGSLLRTAHGFPQFRSQARDLLIILQPDRHRRRRQQILKEEYLRV